MLVDNYRSIYSHLAILSNDDSIPIKKRIYYATAYKNKNENIIPNGNDSDSLIDALRNFSVKYELDDKKLLKNYKFVISFDDIIFLIKYCLESQKKLNEYNSENMNNIKYFTDIFINKISNYIYSYEKVEKIEPKFTINRTMKLSSNKENNNNFNNNTHKKNKKKSSISIVKSSSCWVNIKKMKVKQNKSKEVLHRNYVSNLKNNKRTINTTNINNKTKNTTKNSIKKDINIISDEDNNYTKSYYKRKNFSTIFFPEKKANKKDNEKIKVTKCTINKSMERRNSKSPYNGYLKNNIHNKENSKNINTNKSLEIRKNHKSDNKNDTKPITIFSACEFIKSSSFILKNKNKDENKLDKTSNYNSNSSVIDTSDINSKKNGNKIVFYDKDIMLGIRKKIIKGNVPRPSNYANKLLEKGIKYITDFNGLKEEEQKKKFH